jgi:hypothetical protein
MLPKGSTAHLIATVDGVTMKLDNQKDWMEGRVHIPGSQRRQLPMPCKGAGMMVPTSLPPRRHREDFPLLVLDKGNKGRRNSREYQQSTKSAATELQCPTNKGIPISRINTHSLRSGGANALALVGYSDTQIQKMGR